MKKLLLVAFLLLAQADFAGTGEQFVRLLGNGRFAEARAMFDPEMTRVVSEEKLQASWSEVTTLRGALQEVGKARMEASPPYQVAYVPCKFQKGRLRVKVVLDEQQRVSGLFWLAWQAGAPPPYLKTRVRVKDVQVGAWKLPGKLTAPQSGPVRGVVLMLSGSGPNDMDESLGGSKTFRDLAVGLAAQGIATLRFDKRTRAHGLVLSLTQVTLEEEYFEDALAGLDLLRTELPGKPVYVLGHSLGGMVAPELALRDGKLAGVILLAAPARPIGQGLADQLRHIAKADPTQAVGPLIEKAEHLDSASADDTLLGAPISYWRDLEALQKALPATVARLKCRFLVLQGGRDYQSTAADLAAWKQALKRNATFELFPNLNHLMQPGKGTATPWEYLDENYVAPSVIEAIGKWLTWIPLALAA